MSRGMAWPAVGVVVRPPQIHSGPRKVGACDTTGFGRLEQEDQRLKKHYGRWMDIIRSLDLESFIY